jgi:hypothetical protein
MDHRQPGLPLRQDKMVATQTHDYKPQGTSTLFAALNTAEGTVIGTFQKRHRHQERLKFLRLIEARTPPDKPGCSLVDNYATHKHAKVRRWLAKHPRFTIHLPPHVCVLVEQVRTLFPRSHRQSPRPQHLQAPRRTVRRH